MQWLPTWLARTYAKIYLQKREASFTFAEAARMLGISEERRLAHALARLRSYGYLRVTRDPTDSRKKLFNLLDPVSTTIAFAIQSRAKGPELKDKLEAAHPLLDYYIGGAYAAYQYHRYLEPATIDISVRPNELSTWIALVSNRDTAISIDERPAEKPSATNVHFKTDFDPQLAEDTITKDGIRYLSPELLIANGLSENYPGLEDVIGILIVQRKKLDWDLLAGLCKQRNVSRILAAILDMLNLESSRTLFDSKKIGRIATGTSKKLRLDFPTNKKSEPPEEAYSGIASKWNAVPHFRRSLLSKLVTDLVRSK
jgi:hypothetical protein